MSRIDRIVARNGAKAATKIEPDELRDLLGKLDAQEEAALDVEEVMLLLRRKYRLRNGDAVKRDGTIVRAPDA